MAIGISFLPSNENAANGPQQQRREAGGGDLTDAFKVLSLQLPQVLGAQSLAKRKLLTSPGSSGSPVDPNAAVFQSLIKAMLGGDESYRPSAPGGNPYMDFGRKEPRMGYPGTGDPGPRVTAPPDFRAPNPNIYFDNPWPGAGGDYHNPVAKTPVEGVDYLVNRPWLGSINPPSERDDFSGLFGNEG